MSSQQPLTTPLDGAESRADVGGKAWGLACCSRLGVRVPESVVLRPVALETFLADNDLLEPVECHLREAVAKTQRELQFDYEELCRLVHRKPLSVELVEEAREVMVPLFRQAPAGLAVRSSAVCEDSERASFAGVFDSVLGVRDVESLLLAIRRCWCALWSPGALRYAARMGVEPSVSGMAVLVQRVVPAQRAGVIYTAEPDTGNPWRFELHATEGLAVDLLSGSGVGEKWVLDWETGRVLSAGGDGVATLADSEAAAVACLARRLDEAMSQRLDVEWVLSADGLWVVQARPMVALPAFFPDVPREMEEGSWQRAMFTLPLRADQPAHRVTPFYRDFSESEMWYRYQPEDIVLTGIWRQERDVHGYRYVASGPHPNFFEYFHDIADFEGWLLEHEPSYRQRWDGRQGELDAIERSARSVMRDTSTLEELIGATLEVRDRLWDLNAFGWSGPQALGWMCEALLRHTVSPLDPEFRLEPLLGGADSYTFELTSALQALGRSVVARSVEPVFDELGLEEVLGELLSRDSSCPFVSAFESLCWRLGKLPPSWRGRPSFWSTGLVDFEVTAMHTVRSSLRGLSRDVVAVQREQKQTRDRAETSLRSKVEAGEPTLWARVERMLEWTRYWTQALNDRHGVTVGLLWERELIWQLGSRLVAEGVIGEPEDVLLFERHELESFVSQGDATELAAVIRSRKRVLRRQERLMAPELLCSSRAASVVAENEAADDTPDDAGRLFGVGVARGVATGRARRVEKLDAAFLETLDRSDILVLSSDNAFAYADWHSLLTIVGGVVSRGRPAHHLTQVARECGVPIVGHLAAADAITEGTDVEIDGTKGVVRLRR